MLAMLCLLLPVGCRPAEDLAVVHLLDGETMGTTWTVKVVAGPQTPSPEALLAVVRAELELVDAKMSSWRDDSELVALNEWQGQEGFEVSSATFDVLREAIEISRISGGAFDVTAAPLVDAWGFGPPGRALSAPSEETLERLREVVGWQGLVLDEKRSAVIKAHPGVRLDLSAIAKGYAVDRVSEALVDSGASRHMVEVGGEVRTEGRNGDDEAWRIAVERPLEQRRELHAVIALSGRSMATSGDYRNYYQLEGRRVSHTIDPRTQRPIEHALASVSVVDTTCMRADALATAFMVLGEAGVELAGREGIAAVFLFREPDGTFRERSTPAFLALRESSSATTP